MEQTPAPAYIDQFQVPVEVGAASDIPALQHMVTLGQAVFIAHDGLPPRSSKHWIEYSTLKSFQQVPRTDGNAMQ